MLFVVKTTPKVGSGIYLWLNRVNSKVYVGSAARGLNVRLKEYRRNFPRGLVHNKHLQNAWNKYGAKSFVFCIVERCAAEKCLEREMYWISFYGATDPSRGYNLCEGGGSTLGYHHTEETKSKYRKFHPSPEHRAILIESNKTRVWKEESLKKKSEATKLLWKDPVWRANQIAKRVGKSQSAATKHKRAVANTGQKRSEEFKLAAKLRMKAFLADNPIEHQKLVQRCLIMTKKASQVNHNRAEQRKLDKAIRGSK